MYPLVHSHIGDVPDQKTVCRTIHNCGVNLGRDVEKYWNPINGMQFVVWCNNVLDASLIWVTSGLRQIKKWLYADGFDPSGAITAILERKFQRDSIGQCSSLCRRPHVRNYHLFNQHMGSVCVLGSAPEFIGSNPKSRGNTYQSQRCEYQGSSESNYPPVGRRLSLGILGILFGFGISLWGCGHFYDERSRVGAALIGYTGWIWWTIGNVSTWSWRL